MSGEFTKRLGGKGQLRAHPSRNGCLHAHDFNLEAAEVRMVVFANAIGEINEAALNESKLNSAFSQIPADGADGADRRGRSGQPC